MDKDIREILEGLSLQEILDCKDRMQARAYKSTAAANIVKAIRVYLTEKE